jgi:hypothetical protein
MTSPDGPPALVGAEQGASAFCTTYHDVNCVLPENGYGFLLYGIHLKVLVGQIALEHFYAYLYYRFY